MPSNQKILKYKIEDVKDLILVDKKLDTQFVEKVHDFINYISDFYGKDGIYEDFFKPSLSKKEIRDAVALVITKDTNFDSLTRETVRDIMLFKRGERTTEFNVREQFPELNLYNEKSPRGDFICKYNPENYQEKTDILASIWSGNKTIYVDAQHMDWLSNIPTNDCSIVQKEEPKQFKVIQASYYADDAVIATFKTKQEAQTYIERQEKEQGIDMYSFLEIDENDNPSEIIAKAVKPVQTTLQEEQ
jgi:hypothetical protein